MTTPDPINPTETPQPAQFLWLRLLGLRRRHGKRIGIAPTRWGYVLLAMTLFIGGGLGFAEYSMQPDFCRSCHLMEPYYQAWHSSTHKDVPCTDCHFEPGLRNTLKGKWEASTQAVKWATNTYGSKPHAQVHDSSCMRSGCHEKRLLEGSVEWDVPTQRGGTVTINFDHAPHINEERRGKQLRCVSCHSQIVQGQHLVVTLDTCYLCHFKGFEHGRNEHAMTGCTSCHAAPKKEIHLATGIFKHSDYLDRGVTCENCHSDTIKGDGAVPRQVCWNCHNQPAAVAKYSETNFLHTKHISDHKIACASCHIQIEHHLSVAGSLTQRKGSVNDPGAFAGACGQCHEQTHSGPADLYRGTGGRGVPDMPSPMFRAEVDCIACHKERQRPDDAATVLGQTYTAAQASCDYCHGTKYAGALDNWRAYVTSKLEEAEIEFTTATDALAKSSLTGAQRLKGQRLLDDATHNIRLVKLGHGVHNVNYATAVLNVAIERSLEVIAMVEKERREQ